MCRRELRIFAGQKFGAQEKMLSSFALVREEGNGMEEVWTGKCYYCFVA